MLFIIISLYQGIVRIQIVYLCIHTTYIYMDASICVTRNHQELPSYPKAAQPDASTWEPQKAPSQLCCRGVSLGHPGPKTRGCGFQISPTGAAASICFASDKWTKENTPLNLGEANGFPLPPSLSVQVSMNHACLALTGPRVKVSAVSKWKCGKLEDWTTTFQFRGCLI